LKKTITIIKQEQKNVSDIFTQGVDTDLLFRELQKDTIGRSGSSPTWGYVYSNKNRELKYKGIAYTRDMIMIIHWLLFQKRLGLYLEMNY